MKNLLLAIAIIAISIPTFSQVKVRPGLRLGLNAATITNHEDSERKIGFDGAIFANIHFTSFYELQPELTYSNQGFKRRNIIYYTGNGTNEIGGGFNINYIGLSVANKFFVVPNTGLHFIVGPSIEMNVSDDSQYDDITPIDFSLFGGVGYEFPMGLGIEARFKQGLIDVRKDYYDDPNYHDDNELYNYNNKLNSVFQLNVSYKFDF